MTDADDGHRMTGGELQTVREYLGLTTEHLAAMLDVRHDTARRWESGRDPIPYRVREEVEQIEEHTARAVDDLVAALQDARDPAVVVYRTDADMHAARPDTTHLPARWWRHVVARAAEQVPGVEIGTRTELES
jgi:transcriptional regulator with XRE-family HTH domain